MSGVYIGLLFSEKWDPYADKGALSQTSCFEVRQRYFTYDFAKELFLSLIGMVPFNGLKVDIWLKRICNNQWFKEWSELVSFNDLNSKEQCRVLALLLKNVIFVETQEVLERQRIQQGLYMMVPNKVELDDGELMIKQDIPEFYLKDSNAGRMIISAEHKKNILRELNLIGINEGFLFGDSIDYVCRQIKRDI